MNRRDFILDTGLVAGALLTGQTVHGQSLPVNSSPEKGKNKWQRIR